MSLFLPISAPILRSVDPVQVARFLKERERYEIEISSKQSELPSLRELPFTASIDRSLLKSLFYMGKFDSLAPNATQVNDLTNDHIKNYIDSIVSVSDGDVIDPTIIDKALEGLTTPTDIANPEARIIHYCADFFERLEGIGHSNFRDKNPKLTVKLLLKRLSPKPLKQEMIRRVQYDDSLEKNVKKFISALIREAINCHTYAVTEKNAVDSMTREKGQKSGKSSKGTGGNQDKARKEQKDKETPLCLWEEHKKKGIRHLLRNCKDCPKDEKDRLFNDLRTEKKTTGSAAKRAAAKFNATDGANTSVTFNATFDGTWRSSICADNGADANIIDMRTINEMSISGAVCNTTPLLRPRSFEMAASLENGKPATLTCTKTTTMDVELHIRHGTALILRGVQWLITDQAVGEPLLGRPLL